VEPMTRGDPMQPLLWTCRSLRNLVKGLATEGHLKLTRFRGHRNICVSGAHDGENETTLQP